MGYTHFYHQQRSFSKDEWNTLKELTQEIINYCEVPLEDIEITDNRISFNGVDEDGHETFYINVIPHIPPWSDEPFDFCKTARKPYDVPVAMVLLAVHHFFPDVMNITSDGDWDEDTRELNYAGGWVHIREKFADFFDEEPSCPWE